MACSHIAYDGYGHVEYEDHGYNVWPVQTGTVSHRQELQSIGHVAATIGHWRLYT